MVFTFGDPVWAARLKLTWTRYLIYVFCLCLGGVTLGLILAGHIAVSQDTAAWIILVAAIAALARQRWRPGLWLPQIARQVPVRLSRRKWSGPIVFGWLLGLGVFTYIPSGSMYVYVLAVLLSSARGAMYSGIAFGAVYGLATLFASRLLWSKPHIEQARAIGVFSKRLEPSILAATALVPGVVIALALTA